jgi:hypothetical protein
MILRRIMEEFLTQSQKEVRLGVIRAVLAVSVLGQFKTDKNGRTFLSVTNANLPFFWQHVGKGGGVINGTMKSLVVYRTARGYSCLVNVNSGKWIGRRAYAFRFRLMPTKKGVTAWTGAGFKNDNYLGSFESGELWMKRAFMEIVSQNA